MKRYLVAGALFAAARLVHADVYVLDSDTVAAHQHKVHPGAVVPAQAKRLTASGGHTFKSGDKPGVALRSVTPRATGSQGLIDMSGVKYFINTNITFSTSSSASAAMSEASYTHATAASTMNGGTTMSTLNDAYDGYNTICLSLNNTVATCQTGNANFVIYNKNGPAAFDSTCPNNRQLTFPVQTSGSIQMYRKVYVPTDDSFARWLNYFTNTGASPATVTMVVANNLGSDSNTRITGSSSGDTTATTADTWITSFQNYSGTTSSDPRLGHVLYGPGAAVPVTGINFVDGDDNPFWGYTFTLQPGQTRMIANFAVDQPSKAAAAAQSARLVGLPSTAVECMSGTDLSEMANFAFAPPTVTSTPGPGRFALTLLIALLAGIGLLGLRAWAR